MEATWLLDSPRSEGRQVRRFGDAMTQRYSGVIVVQCRYCGERVSTGIPIVADHFIDNGCPDCQRRFNARAERLLQQVDGLARPPG